MCAMYRHIPALTIHYQHSWHAQYFGVPCLGTLPARYDMPKHRSCLPILQSLLLIPFVSPMPRVPPFPFSPVGPLHHSRWSPPHGSQSPVPPPLAPVLPVLPTPSSPSKRREKLRRYGIGCCFTQGVYKFSPSKILLCRVIAQPCKIAKWVIRTRWKVWKMISI